jgi:hypothetical protein
MSIPIRETTRESLIRKHSGACKFDLSTLKIVRMTAANFIRQIPHSKKIQQVRATLQEADEQLRILRNLTPEGAELAHLLDVRHFDRATKRMLKRIQSLAGDCT